jgi:hypothetical protein
VPEIIEKETHVIGARLPIAAYRKLRAIARQLEDEQGGIHSIADAICWLLGLDGVNHFIGYGSTAKKGGK